MKEYSTYDEVRTEVFSLHSQKKIAEAIALLEHVRNEFPENMYSITWNLAVLYREDGAYRKALKVFEEGMEKGLIYPLWRGAEFWEPLESYDEFDALMKKTERQRKEATALTTPKAEVQLPTTHAPENVSPLFITLHGGGESIAEIREKWHSPTIDNRYIHAFIQSSQVFSQNGFSWTDVELGRKDIRSIYEAIIEGHPVDTNRVIIGGFSQGGGMALDIVFTDIIPVMGFVVLCPHGAYSDMPLKAVTGATQRGVRGSIITGSHDNDIQLQRKMKAVCSDADLPLQFIEVETEHWYPKNFPDHLDAAIAYITKSEK